MKTNRPPKNPYRLLAKYLEGLGPFMREMDAPAELDEAAHLVARFLSRTPPSEIRRIIELDRLGNKKEDSPLASFKDLSSDDVSRMLVEESLSRKVLERIAIERFGVPRGSMRSFPTVQVLRQKILTLVENERAHQVISEAAKRSAQ